MIVLVILLLIAARILFQKRPAESCGKVLIFPHTEFPVKLLLTLPVSLLCGCYFMNISLKDRSLFWLIAGILFGAYTLHGILETFFRFDLHGMISKLLQLSAIAGIALFIAASFYFDWWNYDSYLPDPGNVAAIAVSPAGLDDASWQYDDPDSESFLITDTNDTRLSTIRLTGENKQIALDWLKTLYPFDSPASVPDKELTPVSYVAAAYALDNGKTRYRKYPIYDIMSLDSFRLIYDMEEFKSGTNPLASHETTGRQHFVWSNGPETYHLDLTYEENEALLAAYKKDLEELHIDTLKQEFPIGTLSLSYGNYGSSDAGFIYPDFQNTLHLLEQNGIPAKAALSSDYEICRIFLYQITRESSTGSTTERKKVLLEEITDAEDIQALQPWLIYSGFAVNPILNPVDTRYEVTVLFRNSDGATYDYADAFLRIGNPIE